MAITAILPAGQHWTNGTPIQPNIKISIEYIQRIIHLVTIGAVNARDLAMVIGPDTAWAMSVSPEINAIMANSVWALGNLTGEMWFNERYALPDVLYGMRIIVDDTVQVTNDKLQTPAPLSAYNFIYPKGVAYVLTIEESRAVGEGGKKGKVIPTVKKNNRPEAEMSGGERDKSNYFPAISTLVQWSREDLSVEAMEFPWDRLVSGSVCSDFTVSLTNSKSGFYAAHCCG